MGPNGKRIIEPHPEIAAIIKPIFQWYATGQCSLAEVTDRACSAGLVSRQLKGPVSKSNIHKLLRKRFYTGDFDWKGKTCRGSHEPGKCFVLFPGAFLDDAARRRISWFVDSTS